MRTTIQAAAATLLLFSAGGELSAQETAHWFIGTYTNDLLVWDEASEEVVDRITMRHPIPADITLSEDRTRIYVREAQARVIEVVDVASRTVVDEITLSEGNVGVRINSFAPHPSHQTAIMQVMRYTKHIDRYEVEGPFIVKYDLEAKQVTDTIPHPDGHEPDNSGYRVGFRYSPDGESVYFFTDDIIALDAETFEEIDRWELSHPLEPGLGRTFFSLAPNTYDEAGVTTGLFRMTDPAQNRRMMGISHVRLADQEVDFYTLGNAEPIREFTVAPGGQKAYGIYDEIGHYEFWEFDLASRRVTRRQPFAGRPRMGLQVSADGEKILVYVAGHTIDVYDAQTFELMRTVELDDDMTEVAIVPTAGR